MGSTGPPRVAGDRVESRRKLNMMHRTRPARGNEHGRRGSRQRRVGGPVPGCRRQLGEADEALGASDDAVGNAPAVLRSSLASRHPIGDIVERSDRSACLRDSHRSTRHRQGHRRRPFAVRSVTSAPAQLSPSSKLSSPTEGKDAQPLIASAAPAAEENPASSVVCWLPWELARLPSTPIRRSRRLRRQS